MLTTQQAQSSSQGTSLKALRRAAKRGQAACQTLPALIDVVVLWIDWYPYHVARFKALLKHPRLNGTVFGLEMVGGTGVHSGLKFREELPADLPVSTVFPTGDWHSLSKWKIARAIWKRLNQLNPATLLVPGYYNLPALAMAAWAKCKGKQSVLLTESTEGDHRRVWWRETLKSLLIRSLFDWAVAGGKPHRRYLEHLSFQPDRIARFYDVVDNTFFRERTQEERIRFRSSERNLPEKFFLYVGRLASEKNTDTLLQAYFAYRQQGGSWSLLLVGGGPEEAKVRQMAKDSPFSEEIRFEGLKTSGELIRYYAFASCFILPSSREPWGLVVNEAMAAGLPVIVSDVCGCAEDLVIHGENGFLFDSQSAQSLQQCLQTMDQLTFFEWNKMGSRSLEIIAAYSPEAWAAEVVRVAGL